MERNSKIADTVLIVAFIVMILITAIITWYRLVIMENFRYVVDDNDSPERLDLSTY